ncbi:MAG: IS3 family transposase [Nitrospirales bacterium]|nr:IS3 family transposase [Nitrospirales bacterium]MDR4483762.1 IS3 family transposase [Nitrospirales bacterium]
MRYAFIQNHRKAFPVSLLCQVLEEGRSRFYAWLKRPASPRARENRRLVEAIKAVHYRSRQTCGSPRIPTDLQAQRQTCGKYRMAQLMRGMELSHGTNEHTKPPPTRNMCIQSRLTV